MKITFDKKDAEKIIYSALCNSTSVIVGCGLALKYDDKQYAVARIKLGNTEPNGTNNTVCFEDVLMQILRDGDALTFEDTEGDGEQTRELTLASAADNLNKITSFSDLRLALGILDDDGDMDAWEDFNMLQICLYGEVIFG